MASRREPLVRDGGTVRVLHVDDEPAFAEMAAEFLERENDSFEVHTATDADAGIEFLAESAVDCVVSDYEMPGTNGVEFLRHIRAEHGDLPFVLFTGKGSEEVASEAVSAGATDYLQKEGGSDQYTLLANRIENAVEQYRSKRELEANRKRLDLFFHQSPLGVIEWDEEFTAVRANDAAAEILGYSPAEFRGRSWEEIVTEAEREAVGEVVSELLAAEGGYHSINENVTKNGDVVICEWHNRVVTDESGETVAIFSQFQDVTDRERRKRRLEALFEHSPNMVDVHDTEGTIVDANPRFCEQLGYEEGEAVGKKVWEIDVAVEPEEIREVWETMSTGDRFETQGEYRRRDGSTFPVEAHVRRIEMADGDRFAVISRDVTERVEREREQEAVKERMEFALDATDSLIFEVDLATLESTRHGPIERVFGTEYGELDTTEEFLQQVVHPEDRERVRQYQQPETLRENSEIRYEYRTNPENGTVRTLRTKAYVKHGPDGEPREVIGLDTDITDLKERERRLEQQNERLREFVGAVSHDLRNPLSVAEGNLELARLEGDAEHFDAVERGHERMRTLIAELLTWAREDRVPLQREPVDLATAAERSWRTVETGNARLVVDADRIVSADRNRLEQLLGNLLRNAVEHGTDADGGGVTVTVGDCEDGFYVADDGPGIPAGKRERIFETGYSTLEGGTGFGLDIVERIAERHGWTVTVTGSDAGGARFEMTGLDREDRSL